MRKRNKSSHNKKKEEILSLLLGESQALHEFIEEKKKG